jgi:hypothetical protein
MTAAARPLFACGGCAAAYERSRKSGGEPHLCNADHEHGFLAATGTVVTRTPAVYRVAGLPAPARRALKPRSDRDEDLIHAFVADVLQWSRGVARLESAAGASTSTWLLGVLQTTDGRVWLGTGCSGTKGAGRAPTPDREGVTVDPVADGRYRGLAIEHKRTVDAITCDGQGECLLAVRVGTRDVTCTLGQRVAMRIAPVETAARWQRKIAVGDSSPALKAASVYGEPRLLAAARAWWGLSE